MSSEVDLTARTLSESPTSGNHSLLATVATIFAVAYPLIVYTGLTRWGTRWVALWFLAALALRLVFGAATRRANSPKWTQGLVSLAPAIALGAVAAWTRDALFLLLFPVLMNATLLFVFARSLLRPTTIVEDFARQIDGDLTPDEVRYCTSLTRAWCVFFAANGTVCAALAAFAPLTWWTLYTGFLAYVWIGLFFAVEFVVRRYRFRRFGSGWIDRLLARWFEGDAPGDWMSRAEKGGVRSLRLVLFICRYLGRAPIRFVLWFVAAYYVSTDPELRRNSRRYLRRVGIPPTLGSVYRHVRTFAFCATDRIFFLRGDLGCFKISRVGHEHVARLRRQGQGAILVGAHFGSYEALRAAAEEDDVPLSIVAWFDNTAMSYAIYESLAPELARRVIRVRPTRRSMASFSGSWVSANGVSAIVMPAYLLSMGFGSKLST